VTTGHSGLVANAADADANDTRDDEQGLSAYGDAFDVVARVPTLAGAAVAAIAAALVWLWRRLMRTHGRYGPGEQSCR
jgi:hypothetical protein